MPDSLNTMIFFDKSPLPAWICEPKTLKVTHVNQAALRLFGFSRSQWLKDTLHNRLTGVELKKNTLSMPVRIEAKDGRVHLLQMHLNTFMFRKKKLVLLTAHERSGNCSPEEQISDHSGMLRDIADKRSTVLESAAKTRQIKNILNGITDGFFAVDKQWNFIQTNDRFQKIEGYEGGSLEGKNIWTTFPHLRNSIVYEEYTRAMESGKAGYVEFSSSYSKGVVYDVHMYPYSEGLFVYFRDISQRKKNEEEAAKLALIASRTSNAVILTDREGHITWVNEGFERITEFTLAEVFGKKPGSFLQGPDTNAQTILYMRNCLAAAKFFRTEILNYSKSRRKYWIDIEVMPVKDDAGEVTGFMAIESDITVLKTAIHEMLKSQVQLQTIMDNAPLVVSLKDLRGNYTFYNKFFVKYFPGNYPYKAVTDYDIFSKEDADNFRASDHYIIQTGKTIEIEQDITVKGKKDSYYTIKFPLQDDDNKIYAIGGVSLRITDRRQAARELQQNRITLERQNRILEVINQIQLQFIKDVKPSIYFETVLKNILKLTRSEFGFIGEVLYMGGQRCLKVYSITDIAWDDKTQERYEENPQEGLEFYNVKTLFEAVLSNGKPVMVNTSPDNLYNGMMPDGRPVLKAFLGIPIFKGTRQVGMIGLANRPEGYGDDMFKEIQPLAGVLGSIIEAFRNDQRRRQAEESLRESEQRFRVMADSAPVMIWMADVDKKCNYLNKGWLDYTGSSLENELGSVRISGIYPDDAKQYIELYETSFDKRIPFAMEYRLLRHDGEYRWVVDNGSPRHLPSGEFIGYIGTCMDIHTRKLAEQSLAKSESRYRSIVENQQEMICRYTKDGKLTFVNQSYADTFGYKIHELIGKSFFEFVPKEMHDTNKISIDRIFKGELEPDPEEQIILVKGEKRWQHWINLPLKNSEGKVYEVQAIGHDVTKRKELEAEQARLDKIVRESYNEIYLFNWDTLRFEFANASALRNIGYEQRELAEKKLTDLFSYPDEMALQALLNPLRRGQTDRLQLQIKHNRKDGTYYDVDTLIQVLEWNRSFVVIATDITQKLKTEKKLRATILEKETLIKEIHHRVKNNLQLISSIIYIKMASLEAPELKQFLESTRQRIRSVALIHERLLQSEKIDKVDISDYLGKLVYDLKITNYRQDLSLEIRTDIQENVLDLDTAIYCGLIVNELITNAIKYAFTDRIVGMIEVGFRREEGSFLLSVIDNGITIPVNIMPGQSSSFGMHLLEIFVRQLGGTVEIIREKGTKFQIRF